MRNVEGETNHDPVEAFLEGGAPVKAWYQQGVLCVTRDGEFIQDIVFDKDGQQIPYKKPKK